MKLSELIQLFCDGLDHQGLADRTRLEYRAKLLDFARCLGEALELPTLNLEHLGTYVASLERFAPTTRAEGWRQVRRFLNWAHAEGYLVRAFWSHIALPHRRPEGWIPSPDQVAALLAAPGDSVLGQRDQLVLELLYGSGLRRSECSALELRDWDPELSGLWVRQGKGQKDRLQPVGSFLSSRIQEYVHVIRPRLRPAPEEPALLLTRSGRRFHHYNVAELLRRYGRQLKLPKLTAHALRRAYANHMLQNGAQVAHLQQLLSHQSPETTLRYTQTSLEEVREEHRRCHPRAHRRGRPL